MTVRRVYLYLLRMWDRSPIGIATITLKLGRVIQSKHGWFGGRLSQKESTKDIKKSIRSLVQRAYMGGM